MTYSFKCRKCNFTFDMFRIPIDERDTVKPICPSCHSDKCKRVMTPFTFSFNENPNKSESAKPDSYWENAEKRRIANLDKKRKERFDKVMAGDTEERRKLRNKMQNEHRLGKYMKDEGRIRHAKEIGELIGEKL